MFAYALAKAVRKGYLPAHYFDNASRAYQGILKQFINVGADGSVNLTGAVSGVGLTPDRTRENSYAYYVSTPVISNDPKTVGAFIMASVEIETAAHSAQRTVHGKPAQSPGTGN
jgi:unsaturated rhamnogalacturonyl hydrolase